MDEFVDTVRVPSRFCLERDVCCSCLESPESEYFDDASASSTGLAELEEEGYESKVNVNTSQNYDADVESFLRTC